MPHVTVAQAIQLALQHQQAGRSAEAEKIYSEILSQQPDEPNALHFLGVLALQAGKADQAFELIHRSITIFPANPAAFYSLGNAHAVQRNFDKAIAAYSHALEHNPDFFQAHANLGQAFFEQDNLEEALTAYSRAIELNPHFPEAHLGMANVLSRKGKLDDAIKHYTVAIQLKPQLATAHSNLGIALTAQGKLDEAIAAFRLAVVFDPNIPEAYANLGNALREKGQFDEAIVVCRQAIALRPSLAEAHNNFGNALRDKQLLDEAIAAYQKSIALRPNYVEAHNNLGNVLNDKGVQDQAITTYRQAIVLDPNFPEAYNNLGIALTAQGKLDEAIALFRQAIALRPNYADAYRNLGSALTAQRKLDEAIAAYQHAISLRPNFAEAHNNLSLTLLSKGDFLQGWEEHTWRWKSKDFSSPRRNFAQPEWDGSLAGDQTLLLHAEQGSGDTIQFIRYLTLVSQQCGKIIIECPANLQRLFQTLTGEHRIVARGQILPDFDLHCPLLSLPRLFGTTLNSIPNAVPYLSATVQDAANWQHRLEIHDSVLKVGLAWAGSPTHKNDRNRSIKLARLAPLGKVAGVRFFSLQKGEPAAEGEAPPPGIELVNWTGDLNDFADTASLIANLDLVIAVDTAVAHLAGAMGKPVWTLLPFVPDWRWLLDREDSPWYPTMRLFRQKSHGDWNDVVDRVAKELQTRV